MKNESFVQGFLDELSKHGGALEKYKKGMSATSKYKHGTGRGMGELRRLGRKAGRQPFAGKDPKRVAALKEHLRKGLDHDYR